MIRGTYRAWHRWAMIPVIELASPCIFVLGEPSSNMARICNFKLCLAALGCALACFVAGPVALATGAAATARGTLAPFPARTVNFVGFGDGHGDGMGQWGAFGYAAVGHEPYQWILSHYYGGTTLSSSGNVISHDPEISVDLNENDRAPVVVTSGAPFSFGGHSFLPKEAARAVLGSGRWSLFEAPGCSSTKWTPVAAGLVDPLAKPSFKSPAATASQVLTVCEPDGVEVPVRGTVEAYDSPAGAVTLNILPVEEYIRDVISAEVSWSWGLFGGSAGSPQGHPWGFQALEAQAVASRSYVAAEVATGGWSGYATACDSTCQSYKGMADESSLSDAAVSDTAGQVLELRGEPVFTQYSASTGGYSYGGEFPAVADRGDAVCIKSSYYSCNPCHKWFAAVPVVAIEKMFPSIGALSAVEVSHRNGLGALGGRAETVELLGTTGAKLSVAAYALEPLIAHNPNSCVSDWYGVTNGP